MRGVRVLVTMAIKTSTAAHIKNNAIPYAEDLEVVFDKLRSLIAQFKPSLRVIENTASHFEVWTTREISIRGKKLRKGVMFASLVKFRNYVGLYFQPLYFDPNAGGDDLPDVLSLKKGLTCFHFKRLDGNLEKQARLLLERGWQSYRSRNWI